MKPLFIIFLFFNLISVNALNCDRYLDDIFLEMGRLQAIIQLREDSTRRIEKHEQSHENTSSENHMRRGSHFTEFMEADIRFLNRLIRRQESNLRLSESNHKYCLTRISTSEEEINSSLIIDEKLVQKRKDEAYKLLKSYRSIKRMFLNH